MTAVTTESNKIVLSKVKDNEAPLEPSLKIKPMNFLASPVY